MSATAEPNEGCPVFLVHAERTTNTATEYLIMACRNRPTARERAVALWLAGYRDLRINEDWSLSWAEVQQWDTGST
jgi:hypothetical protein